VFGVGLYAAGREAKRREAWDHVRSRLDAGVPCYGWELDVPEYYTIHGYDDAGYYYCGPPDFQKTGPKPWHEVTSGESGPVEMYSIELCEPASDDVVVRDALSTTLAYARTPAEWTVEGRTFGPRAFETWADALEHGAADRFGLGYNGAVWTECRAEAVAFLDEARQRLAPRAPSVFEAAIGQFAVVRDCLTELSELHPFEPESSLPEGESDLVCSPGGAALMQQAGTAERAGLVELERLVAAI
jgi:hypothetical protein